MRKKLRLLSNIISFILIGSLIFLAVGLKSIENYTDWISFSITMLLIGVGLGIAIYAIICYFLPNAKTYKNANGTGLLFPLIFAFTFVCFGAGALINKSAHRSCDCKSYTIKDLGESGSRQRAFYVFIDNGDRIERLSFGKEFNRRHQIGDIVNLCIFTGRLGFKYYRINTST